MEYPKQVMRTSELVKWALPADISTVHFDFPGRHLRGRKLRVHGQAPGCSIPQVLNGGDGSSRRLNARRGRCELTNRHKGGEGGRI